MERHRFALTELRLTTANKTDAGNLRRILRWLRVLHLRVILIIIVLMREKSF